MIYILEGMSGSFKTTAAQQLLEKFPNATLKKGYFTVSEAIDLLKSIPTDAIYIFDRICLYRCFVENASDEDIIELNNYLAIHTDDIKFVTCMTNVKKIFEECFWRQHNQLPPEGMFEYYTKCNNLLTNTIKYDPINSGKTIVEILGV